MTKQPTFIDLFCGCGGWTEGFSQLGYKCLYSVDFWTPAALAHSINHPGIKDDDKAKNILDADVAETVKTKLRSGEIDVLIGSPPCTQFSFSNRGGGGNTVEGMLLVRRFLEFVDFVQNELGRNDFPWVMENVPRLKVFLEKECIDKEKNIYRLNYVDEPDTFYEVRIPKVVILSSADYGAAQKRRRVFCGNLDIPKPTHVSPSVKDNPAKRQAFIDNYKITEAEFEKLKPWRTLGDILASLPSPLDNTSSDRVVVDPNFPNLEITWNKLHDHFYDTRLRPGVELFESHLMKQQHPVYGVMNFPDPEEQPSRTVMATEMVVSRETIIVPVTRGYKPKNLGKRPYEEVLDEHESEKCRGYRRLTVRELACVQGFPITYQLSGKTSSVKHKQIGNAVSPFISRAFGRMFAKDYLNQAGIADVEEKQLLINKPNDINDYESYEHSSDWALRVYKRTGKKFNAHLRTTKSAGQRLDLVLDSDNKEPWQTVLCLGSGKAYRKEIVGAKLKDKLLAAANSGQHAFNGEFDTWVGQILEKIDLKQIVRFTDFDLGSNFDNNGRLVVGTPISMIEDDLDRIIKETVNGSYTALSNAIAEVEFRELGISKSLNLYTIIAAVAMEKLTRLANQVI